ncbi:MAG: RNA-binding protein [Spirochaetales bacterium]|jgi:RNA recognition motif-containing protein|nr:RNA-binding protein [Spirochaetales bacterium]
MANKLYVGNLSYSTDEAELQGIFAQYGEVASVNIITDKMTGRARGFGFVEMATPEAAQAAIEATNGMELRGRQLRVNEAQEQNRTRSRPRGGNDSYGGGGGGYHRGERNDRY